MPLSRSEGLLLQRIQAEMENRAAHIVAGGSRDFTEYRESVGFLDGLRRSVELMEEIQKEIAEGK